MPDHPANAIVKAQVDDPELVRKRQRQIVAAALKTFGRDGYYRTTIKDIAQEAGVSQGSIYQYFADKEDVLLLALLECVDSYAREIPPAAERESDPVARLRAAFAAYCHVVDKNKAAAVLAYRSTKSLDKRRRRLVMQRELETNALISKYVRECIAAGHIREINVDLVTYQLVMMAHSWALKAWHFSRLFALDDYIRGCFDLTLNGLLTSAGRRALTKAHT
jgi:AcrR family transcriptional regulator